jgi:hypothetical protein
MATPSAGRAGLVGRLREKLSGRRERRAKKAYAEAEIKRQWERSGEVGRHGSHEGYSSGSF